MISLDIDIVVWAESREIADYLTAKITRGQLVTASRDIYETKIDYPDQEKNVDYLIDLRGYFRWPKSYIRSFPEGITDILIVNLSSTDSEYFEEARNYLNMRRGIPFKFLTSGEDLSKLADELDCEFIPEEEITNDITLKMLIDLAKNMDYTLRSVFDKIDYDKDGHLRHEELFRISKELAFKMTEEEVKEIAFTLSKDGHISYDRFKKWWIMGRHDFQSFRRVVDMEFTLNNFITKSNAYLEKLKYEVDEISKTTLRNEGKIVITSDEEDKLVHSQKDIIYRDYTNIIFKLVNGVEVDSFVDSLPDYLRICPFSFGIELYLKSAEDGPVVLFSLNRFKEFLYQTPYFKELFEQGALLNFRHIDVNLFIDISISPHLFFDFSSRLAQINFGFEHDIGSANLHFITALRIQEIFDITFKNFIEKLATFKIDCHGEFSNLKYFMAMLTDIIKQYFNDQINDKVFNLISTLILLSNITSLKVDIKYDVKETCKTIREILSTNVLRRFHLADQVVDEESTLNKGLIKAEENFRLLQQRLIEIEAAYRPVVLRFIKPYLEALKMINFDKIHLYLLIPGMRSYIKLGLALFGMNRHLSTKYFR